jgi:hypothetical protein
MVASLSDRFTPSEGALSTINVTWLITREGGGAGGWAKITMGIRIFILQRSQISKRGKFGPIKRKFAFYFFLWIFLFAVIEFSNLGWKNIGRALAPLGHPPPPKLGPCSVSIDSDAGWAPQPVWPLWRQENLLPVLRIELWFLGRLARSHITLLALLVCFIQNEIQFCGLRIMLASILRDR